MNAVSYCFKKKRLQGTLAIQNDNDENLLVFRSNDSNERVIIQLHNVFAVHMLPTTDSAALNNSHHGLNRIWYGLSSPLSRRTSPANSQVDIESQTLFGQSSVAPLNSSLGGSVVKPSQLAELAKEVLAAMPQQSGNMFCVMAVDIKCSPVVKTPHFKIWTFSAEQSYGSVKSFIEVIRVSAGISKTLRVLVLLNPFGGTKEAPHIYKQTLKPLLDLASISTTLIETEKYSNFCGFVRYYVLVCH